MTFGCMNGKQIQTSSIFGDLSKLLYIVVENDLHCFVIV
jgi:hypothetical protein